jgi:hypothetical protein
MGRETTTPDNVIRCRPMKATDLVGGSLHVISLPIGLSTFLRKNLILVASCNLLTIKPSNAQLFVTLCLTALPEWASHQLIRVDGADSRGKVPAGGCSIRFRVRAAGSRKHAFFARRQVAIAGARAVHVHVALGHVIENARACRAVVICGVAGGGAGRAIFASGYRVIDGIRIALEAPSTLVDQRLDAGHDRRRERCSTRAGPTAGSACTGSSAIAYIRPANYVVVAPDAIRGEQRDVRNVAHAVVRNADDT